MSGGDRRTRLTRLAPSPTDEPAGGALTRRRAGAMGGQGRCAGCAKRPLLSVLRGCRASMTHPVWQLLLISVLALIPTALRAQEAAPSPPDPPAQGDKKQEERSTGLPSGIDWKFNFDAGWGTFGFANSLYNN